MMQISDVVLISIDKGEESWAIEGDIIFEDDLSTAFEVTYLPDDDDLEDLSLELNPGNFDRTILKEKIIKSAIEFED